MHASQCTNPHMLPADRETIGIDCSYSKIMSRMLYAPYECKDKSHVECSSSSCQIVPLGPLLNSLSIFVSLACRISIVAF